LVLCTYVSCSHGCEYPLSFVAKNVTPLFGMGAFVGVLARKGWTVRKPMVVVLIAAIFLFSLGNVEIIDPTFTGTALQRALLGVASCLIIAGLVSWEKGNAYKPNLGFLGLLGDASYVLYLVHYPLISILCKLSVRVLPHTILGATTAYAMIVVSCLAVAIAVHLWIEKPLLASLGRSRRLSAA
jgi:exopolysaccharide production protein ExoZ